MKPTDEGPKGAESTEGGTDPLCQGSSGEEGTLGKCIGPIGRTVLGN